MIQGHKPGSWEGRSLMEIFHRPIEKSLNQYQTIDRGEPDRHNRRENEKLVNVGKEYQKSRQPGMRMGRGMKKKGNYFSHQAEKKLTGGRGGGGKLGTSDFWNQHSLGVWKEGGGTPSRRNNSYRIFKFMVGAGPRRGEWGGREFICI